MRSSRRTATRNRSRKAAPLKYLSETEVGGSILPGIWTSISNQTGALRAPPSTTPAARFSARRRELLWRYHDLLANDVHERPKNTDASGQPTRLNAREGIHRRPIVQQIVLIHRGHTEIHSPAARKYRILIEIQLVTRQHDRRIRECRVQRVRTLLTQLVDE